MRVSGAMYSNINDCDEGLLHISNSRWSNSVFVSVFNFWEPLHFLDQGYGFQTWELSPQFAVRSWAYILLHSLPPRLGNIILPGDKVRFRSLSYSYVISQPVCRGRLSLPSASFWQPCPSSRRQHFIGSLLKEFMNG